MARYINPYTDFGFKRLFGEEANKDLLIDFLNTFLPERHRVKTLEFRNTEQLGDIIVNRKAVYDIFCEAENGEQFIVEMQKEGHEFFKDRAIFYSTFPIRSQGQRGKDWSFELKTVYLIAILDFEYDEEEERRKFQRDVQLKDQDGDLFYEKLRYIFLQMPLFTKTESELETHKDKWLYFLKNLSDFKQIPTILQEPVFEKAFATAEVAAMSKDELFSYEVSQMDQWTNYAVWETRMKKALKKSQTEGETQKTIEIARNMKKDGIDSKTIAKYTGLSPEEIERLE